jgi:maltose alpha-D-glucosyltransferase / alpha-amylase
VRPAIDDPVYGYEQVNVADQRRDPGSLLNWTERLIRTRRECPEISCGTFSVLRTGAEAVLVLRHAWRRTSLLTMHNFSSRPQRLRLTIDQAGSPLLVNLFDGSQSRPRNDGRHHVSIEGHGWRWFRAGGADLTLERSTLNVADDEVL